MPNACRPYFWLGEAADRNQEVIDALEKPAAPEPPVLIDTTDIDE